MKEFLKDDEKFFVLFFQGAKNPPIKIQSATNFNFDDSTVAKSLFCWRTEELSFLFRPGDHPEGQKPDRGGQIPSSV